MKKKLDNNALWNEAAITGLFFAAVSIGCLMGKQLVAGTGNAFLTQAVSMVLWLAEFAGCIVLMRQRMIRLRDTYSGVTIQDSYKFGRRAALLSGLLVASAQALILMKMPADSMETMIGQLASQLQLSSSEIDSMGAFVDKLPLWTFIFQWIYCFLYGTVLSAIMSRYVFIQRLFDGPKDDDPSQPDEQ
ncbi:MAG: DUF4199 family protein [Bacteroidales bacterium]|nr:DUF4199 family protein [Bacteroidales bacterium]